jgi:hypothetical protein
VTSVPTTFHTNITADPGAWSTVLIQRDGVTSNPPSLAAKLVDGRTRRGEKNKKMREYSLRFLFISVSF